VSGEFQLRHGERASTTLLILPALFEEANRMRRFTVSLMRGLAEVGFGSVLPDLPGMGESLIDTARVTFEDWTRATASLVAEIRAREGRCLTVAIRGGALLDGVSDAGWRLAPETGERLLRDMVRATALTGSVAASDLDALAQREPTALAGNILSPALYAGLKAAMLSDGACRTVRMDDDAQPADATIAGSRLWRAAEPGDDPAMVAAAVSDIAEWASACAA
jgi:pimeloyl-ACP methyl ester carboxylesterase